MTTPNTAPTPVTTPDAAAESASTAIPPREQARDSGAASAAEARARAIEAANAAIAKSQAADAATNPEGSTETPPTAATPPAAEEPRTPADRTKFAVTARAREQAQRTLQAAEERDRQVAERERAFAAQQKNFDAEVERRAHAAVQQRMANLKKAPAKMLAELGVAPEEFVKAFVSEPQPDPVADLKGELDAIRAQLTEKQATEARARAAAEEAHVVQQYTQSVLGAGDKYPALAARYGESPRELADVANRIATAYHARTGAHASWDQISEYLEGQEQAVLSRYANRTQNAGQQPGQSKGQPPPQVEKGTGPRSTLSAQKTSQRASADIPHKELPPDKQREHLKAVAEKAMAEARAKAAAQ